MEKQQSFDLEPETKGPVECLGMTFESDEARRAYFLERLKEKLQDPEFRKIPGFPKGEDEDILRMSDPPYYTACPNPFLEEFVRVYGRPYDPNEEYHREPFAVDVSVGKTDAVYKGHSYHTKVPHLAIIPCIQHYTVPGDVVLDGFSGSGMTGVATQWSGSGLTGILNDLSTVAGFIGYNYTSAVDHTAFRQTAQRLLKGLKKDLGHLYSTLHHDGRSVGQIEYTIWSEVFRCPHCGSKISFLEATLDPDTQRVADVFQCHSCSTELRKSSLDKVVETVYDPVLNATVSRPSRTPYRIIYRLGDERFEKVPDDEDLRLLADLSASPVPFRVPSTPIPYMHMSHERARLDLAGITHVHHFFMLRPLLALGYLWEQAEQITDVRLRNAVLFLVEQAVWTMSILNRYRPTGFSQVNQYMTGVYYVPSQISEVSPWYALEGKIDRLAKLFQTSKAKQNVACSTGSCTKLLLPDASVDYIFTDPPFGENIYYSDLNYLIESWHQVYTNPDQEAIVDRAKTKGIQEYQDLMVESFSEYGRILKPGRWMTVVFSNSSNAIWRAIQEAIGRAGFVVADVRTLDKQQGSYRQVTSTAMKQDLVISAYKPTALMTDRLNLDSATEDSAWSFVNEHLSNVPLFVSHGREGEVVVERTAQMLLDRMIAFHVQRGMAVPLDAGNFFQGLEHRYAKHDGMYFRQDQVGAYLDHRSKVEKVRQLSFDVTDEASAILWLRVELERKPQSFQDLQPTFMRESQTWAGHEKTVELKDILEENFLEYDGNGPIPSQIHSYLSTNYHDLRSLPKDSPILRAKAAGRWYVPDPNKQSDLDQLRTKRLLKEFQEYKESKQKKLKLFRTEAVRAGFKAAYDQKDYRTIVDVAKKLPEKVIQEDEKLLMYYDVALMRLDED
ncbi:MAG: DNA methyltransferase [Bacillota bacterium]